MAQRSSLLGSFLGPRYRIILSYIGLINCIIGGIMLLPLLALGAYPEEWSIAGGFLWPGLTLMTGGWGLWRLLRPSLNPQPLSPISHWVSFNWRDAAVVVLLSWCIAILFGTIPFMAIADLSFTQAVFESTSGWTTTGLSVLTVEQAPHLILLFRSLSQLFGGAGFAIIALSAIASPLTPGLSSAEGRSEQLVPHVKRSAKWVLSLYGSYVLIGILALRWAGMNWFEAINHSFATLSTGGFSTRPDSIGDWQNPTLEAVTMVLMLLGSLNYMTCHLALTGRWKLAWCSSELRLQACLLGLTGGALAMILWRLQPTAWGQSLRQAGFATVTALSTTGFATVDYANWLAPQLSIGLLITILLMIFGGQSGSTAGGLKLYRIYVLYQGLLWEAKRWFLPVHAVTEAHIWQGDRRQFLSDSQMLKISLHVLFYLAILTLGTGILTAYGHSLQASLFEYASALGTVGLSVGITSATAPPGLLWAEIIGMLLGRLEITTVLIGSLQLTKDINRALRQ